MAKNYSPRRGFPAGPAVRGKDPQRAQMQKLIQATEDMKKAQEEVEERSFTATAGGGVVTAVASGKKLLTSIEIKKEAVNPDDVEMLQDLILTAANEALRQAEDAMDSRMDNLANMLNLGIKL